MKNNDDYKNFHDYNKKHNRNRKIIYVDEKVPFKPLNIKKMDLDILDANHYNKKDKTILQKIKNK